MKQCKNRAGAHPGVPDHFAWRRVMPRSRLAASVALALVSMTLAAACARKAVESSGAATATVPAPATASSTPATSAYPTRVYFGDTHLHTALSLDAGAGGTKLMPEDSYRFAKGEEVTSASGQ